VKHVHCEGAPRDLGQDQGRQLRDEIRAAVGADTPWSRLLAHRPDAATTTLHRDLRRYFPHQAEWLESMARAAGVPQRSLLRALLADATPVAPVALGFRGEAGVRIAIPVPPRAIVRTLRPEGRFASVEVSRPTATSPIAGVNEAGLVVAVVPRHLSPSRFCAPVWLFARDCLDRFENVEPALEWCLSRPAAVGGALLLADASGALVGVDASAPARRTLAASGEWLALGAAAREPPALPKTEQLADAEEMDSALAATLASLAPTPGVSLLVDPIGRRLRVSGDGWVAFEAESVSA